MRKRDRRALEEYVRWIANEIELRDWTIIVDIAAVASPERADGQEWGATSQSIPGRKACTLTFPTEFRDRRLEEVRSTVVHELVHAHHAPMWEMVRIDLAPSLVQPTYDMFCCGYERWMEFAVDAVADALAKHLPLIEWPKAKA